MEKLPKLIKCEIATYLSGLDLFNYLTLNSTMSRLKRGRDVWVGLILKQYPKFYPMALKLEQCEELYHNIVADEESGYPRELLDVFHNCGYFISTCPTLDLGSRRGRTDYIDFVGPDMMSAPVMKYKDCCQRIGIIFRLQGISEQDSLEGMKISTIKGTLALFKRYPPEYGRDIWAYAWGKNKCIIQEIYSEFHLASDHLGSPYMCCKNCPFWSSENTILNCFNKNVIIGLLTGTDKLFALY